MTDTQKLRELLAKGTPGPWKQWPYYTTLIVESDTMAFIKAVADAPLVADAALIVAAVNALPELLDEVERLREAGTEALEYGRSVMRLLEKEGGAIVPYLMDTDDNTGQRFRFALVRLAAALKGNGDE